MPRTLTLAVAFSVAMGFLGFAPPAHAASKGSIALTLVSPKGVPVSVRLTSGKRVAIAAKAPAGTSRTSKLSVAAGTWKPKLTPISVDGRLFRAVSKPSSVRVKSKRTSKLRVTFTEIKVARDIAVGEVSEQSAEFTFAKAAVRGATTRVRLARGTKAPASSSSGTPVTLETSARARALALSPGTAYTVGLFTKVGKTWYGPVSRTFSTDAPASEDRTTATFVVSENTVLLAPTDQFEATPVRAQAQPLPAASADRRSRPKIAGSATLTVPTVDLRLAGQPARISQTYVVPPTPSLPGGFVGTVFSVSASGTAKLHQAPVSKAMDMADIKVPKIDVPSKELTPSQATDDPSCKLGSKAAWDITPPTIEFDASGRFVLDRSGFTIDSKVVATLKASIGAHLETGVTCDFKLPSVKRTFAAGPIPMAIEFTPKLTASAQGTIKVSGFGFTAAAGYSSHAVLPLPGNGDVRVTTDTIQDFDWTTPTATATGDLDVAASGTLEIGPGVASDVAGLTAGITGTFTPLQGHAGITSDPEHGACITASAGGSASLGLQAKAWVDLVVWKYEASASREILSRTWDYGKRQTWPAACDSKPTPAANYTVVSTSASGELGNGRSERVDIDAAGSTVAFSSSATNLVEGDTNGAQDVFVRHLNPVDGPVLASVGANGEPANAESHSPAISPDGRFVAFASNASNLVEDDNNGVTDVFVRDLELGRTELVTRNPRGEPANGSSNSEVSISEDGKYVAYTSTATDLASQSGPTRYNRVFRTELATGLTTAIPLDPTYRTCTNFEPDVSADGESIAWWCEGNVYFWREGDQEPTLLSLSGYGGSVSDDGQTVVFATHVEGEANQQQVQRWSRGTSEAQVVATIEGGGRPQISRDGSTIAWASFVKNWAGGGAVPVAVYHLRDGTTSLITMSASGEPLRGNNFMPRLSGDGRITAFSSQGASDYIPNASDNDYNLVVAN